MYKGIEKPRVILIGGGIHGITSALALASAGANVVVLEKNAEILQGTSGATHNRAHMGYHYPRSIETAQECLRGLDYFKTKYPMALYHPPQAYYFIEKKESKTSTEDYIKFCEQIRIPYKHEFPSKMLINKDYIDSSFLVPEPCFNLKVLRDLLTEKAQKSGIVVKTATTVIQSEQDKGGIHNVTVNSGGVEECLRADIVINATYALANDVLQISGLGADRTEYCYHTTEVVVVRSSGLFIPPLTVMDGPFISVMPYAGYNNLHLVYDVSFSVVHKEIGLSYKKPNMLKSNWEKMIEHGKKFFPFMDSLEYVTSLWGSRPVPVSDKVDARHTRIMHHKTSPGFYSILEGKFISAPLIAQQLLDMIKLDGFMK